MDRKLFNEEHELFRQSFRKFVEREVVPNQERWRRQGSVDRDTWRKAGEGGFLCSWLSAEHGGAGGDFLHSVVVIEELAKIYESGFAMSLHSDIIVPYIEEFGDAEQKQRWLPGCASGEIVTAIAMTEPGTGSDLASISTTAVRDGGDYVINGAKTFISNGVLCDLCIVAAKTDTDPTQAHRGISLIVVESDRTGFVKGRKLEKIGMASQDTAELAFEDCRVPVRNRLSEEGQPNADEIEALLTALRSLRELLPDELQEQLRETIRQVLLLVRGILDLALAYVKERRAFGKPIASFQNTKFKLAEVAAKVEVGRAFADRLVEEHASGKHLVKECSMAKLWHTDMLGQVVDECLQLFGGYGYMAEYPISRAYVDARVQRIFAGTNEIMKVIIAKQLGI